MLFRSLSKKTPLICDVAPSGSGKHFLADFDEAGGIPAVMKEIQPLLATAVMTVTGSSLGDNLKFAAAGDPSVIYPLDTPLAKEGGLIS